MKIQKIVRNLVLIAALGALCVPAQAMWQGAWDSAKKLVQKHPYATALTTIGALGVVGGFGYWKYQQWQLQNEPLTVAKYIREYIAEESNEHYSRVLIEVPVKLIERYFKDKHIDVNAKDFYGRTPLCYACREGDIELIRWLLAKGAFVHSVLHGEYEVGVDDMIGILGYCFDAAIVQSLFHYEDVKDVTEVLMKSDASRYLWNGIFWDGIFNKNDFDSEQKIYNQWLMQEKTGASLKESEVVRLIDFSCFSPVYIGNIPNLVLLAPSNTRWSVALDKPLLFFLCSRNTNMMQGLMPLIMRDQELKSVFIGHIEKFNCLEYQAEIKRMMCAEENTKIMCGILNNKKLVDTHWRFK